MSLVLRGTPLAPGDSAIETLEGTQLRLAIYPRESGGPAPSGVRLGTYRWPVEAEVAAGTWCEDGRCTAMESGRITLREAAADGRLRGSVELRRGDGTVLRGSFDAEWRPRRIFCL